MDDDDRAEDGEQRWNGAVARPPGSWAGLVAALLVAYLVVFAKLGRESLFPWLLFTVFGAVAFTLDPRARAAKRTTFDDASIRVAPARRTFTVVDRSYRADGVTGYATFETATHHGLKLHRSGPDQPIIGFRSAADREAFLGALERARGDAEALPIVTASRIAALSSAFRIALPMALSTLALVALTVSWVLGARAGSIAPIAAVALALLGGLRLSLATHETAVRVTADAVEWTWLGFTRAVAHEEIERVAPLDSDADEGRHAVVLETRRGRVTIATRSPTERALLVAKIEDARARRGGDHDAVVDALRQGGRAARAWLEHLRSVGAGGQVTHRTAAPTPDALADLLADPMARGRDRAAAAIALATRGDPASRKRVRVAAGRARAPDLKRLLVVASADVLDDDAVLEALSALETQPEPARRRLP